jgi:hypothetical protein
MENTTYGWIFAIIIFFIVAGFMNGGFFGNNGNQGALTRGELCQDMNFQDLQNGIREANNNINTGFTGLQRDLCTGLSAVNSAITGVGSQMQTCCCETNRNIDNVRFENAQNTCSIITNANENTQKILDKMCQYEIQGLRDKVVEQNSMIQARDFQLSQLSQTANIEGYINQYVVPRSVPAYLTCSPYQSQALALNGFNGCGNNLI